MGNVPLFCRSLDVERTLFRGGVLSAFGHRDYRILWSGAFVSNVGTWIQTAALLWYVKLHAGSNTWVALVNLASYLPVLFLAVFAGSIADYMDRKRLILVGQTVMMFDALALAIAMSLGAADNAVIIIIAVLMGVATALLLPAWQSIMPDLVPASDILNAVALNSAQFNLARFIGPALGAIIVTVWSASTAFYVNAVSFLFVIAAILAVRTRTPSSPAPPEGMFRHIGAGFRHVWTNRYMSWLLALVALASFFGFSNLVLMPAMAKDILKRGAGAYAWMLGLFGLGAAIAAPLVTYLDRKFSERGVIKLSAVSLGLFLIGFSLSRTYWLTLVLVFGFGASFMMMSSATNAVLQGNSERVMRGRVTSIYVMLLVGAYPVGGQLMGYVSDVRSASFAILLGGCVCLAAGLFLMAFPGLIMGAVSYFHPDEDKAATET